MSAAFRYHPALRDSGRFTLDVFGWPEFGEHGVGCIPKDDAACTRAGLLDLADGMLELRDRCLANARAVHDIRHRHGGWKAREHLIGRADEDNRVVVSGQSRRITSQEIRDLLSTSRVERASSEAMAAKLIATIADTAGLSPVTVSIIVFAPAVAIVR